MASTPNGSSPGKRCHTDSNNDVNLPPSLAVLVWFILPESPRWYAERGKIDLAKKSMRRINGNVANYDLEHEFAVIMQEIEEGRKLSDSTKNINLLSTLRGTNLVSQTRPLVVVWPMLTRLSDEPTSRSCRSLGSSGVVPP